MMKMAGTTLSCKVAIMKLIVSPLVPQVKPWQVSLIPKGLMPTVRDSDLVNFDQTCEFPEWDNALLEKLFGQSCWAMSSSVKHRVLVVDDEESIRLVFSQLLQREGYEVATAENGFDALL